MRSWRRAKPSIAGMIVLALACLPHSLTRAASDVLPDIADGALKEIEVIGRTQFRTGDVVTEEHTGSTARISRAALERSASSLGEVLARESGIQHRQSGGFGSFSNVSIRAASGAQTAIYLDGVLLNNSSNPVLDLSTLELLNLDSIDIYRGSTPLQLGHAAIGGAVNLNTLGSNSPDDRTSRTRLRLGVASFSQQDAQISHQGHYGKWSVVSALSHRSSDNDFKFSSDNNTPLNPNDDRSEMRNNAQVVRQSMLLRTGFQASQDARTDLTLQFSARDSGVPNARNSVDTIASFDTATSQFQLSQLIDDLLGWNTRHTLYVHQDHSRFQDPLGQIGLGQQDTKNDTDVLGASSYWEYLLDTATLGISTSWRREDLDSVDTVGTNGDFSAQRDTLNTTLHYVWTDVAARWTISPALRLTANDLQAQAAPGRSAEFSDRSDTEAGTQLGVGYQLSDAVSFRFNVGNYYRAPSFGELYASYGLVNGNPSLKPEEGVNVDASFVMKRKRLSLEATLFNSERSELIVTGFDSRGVGKPSNNGKARVYGIELSAELTMSPRWSLLGNLTWQDPRSTDKLSGFDNRYLPGEARLSWFSRLQYTLSSLELWYELDTKRDLFYDRANILPAPNIAQHSVGADWKNKHWQVNLELHNLSDENVEDFNGFPKPGRRFQLSVTRSL